MQRQIIEMKTALALLLITSATVIAQDIASTVSTVANKNSVVTTEAFTRAGVTNLVRRTYVRDGTVQLVRQQVYRGTNVALEMIEMDNGLTCSAKTGLDVEVGTHFTPSGKLDTVNLMARDVVTVDHFTVTNGLLYAASTADINKANEIGRDVGTLIRSVTNTTPEQFREQAIELMEKHTKE